MDIFHTCILSKVFFYNCYQPDVACGVIVILHIISWFAAFSVVGGEDDEPN